MKLVIILGVLVAAAFVVCFGWLCESGYVYAIPYVEYGADGKISEKGYHYWSRDFGWVKDGHWENYSNEKVVCEGDFSRGRDVGIWTWRNPDGSPSETSEHRRDGTCKITKYKNGIGTVVSDTANPPPIECSGMHWDDDPTKNDALEKSFRRNREIGMPFDVAVESVLKGRDRAAKEANSASHSKGTTTSTGAP